MGICRSKPSALASDTEAVGADGSLALRRADRQLDALREEADQLDAMMLYLQRQRDAVEDRWSEALSERDRLESELWERAAVAMAEVASAPRLAAEPTEHDRLTPGTPAPPVHWPANARPEPPDLSGRLAPPPPSALLLLHDWGLVEAASPSPPDLTGRHAPRPPIVGPLLEAWELEEVVTPEPDFVPIAETMRISVVPGGRRARPRRSAGTPVAVPLVDTAPISTRHPILR
ncbi:MAG: hypothetical protein AAF721_28920 [Myxococcota bacterium]